MSNFLFKMAEKWNIVSEANQQLLGDIEKVSQMTKLISQQKELIHSVEQEDNFNLDNMDLESF